MALEAETNIRVLTDEECWTRLAEHPARVGRIGLGGPSPDILPVNYAVDGHSVVFRTAEGKKLSAVGRGERVAFEVDDVDAQWRRGWSVVLRGFAEHVTDLRQRQLLEQLPLQPWDPAPKAELVRITGHMISGREIV